MSLGTEEKGRESAAVATKSVFIYFFSVREEGKGKKKVSTKSNYSRTEKRSLHLPLILADVVVVVCRLQYTFPSNPFKASS